MHTYRKADAGGWQVGHADGTSFNPVGPSFTEEFEAAAYAAYLNGGRYSPGEIEHVFPVERTAEAEDDDVHPARPKSLEDYPIDRRK